MYQYVYFAISIHQSCFAGGVFDVIHMRSKGIHNLKQNPLQRFRSVTVYVIKFPRGSIE